jgi:hypothetical protein
VTLEFAYTAPPSDALRVGGPRDDDPVPSRIAFTDSEPDRGRRWLIAKHDPADRATFAVELTMPAEHDAIANGERTVDRAAGAERVVGYALDRADPDLPDGVRDRRARSRRAHELAGCRWRCGSAAAWRSTRRPTSTCWPNS